MDKRYQVFVSSTFKDLEEERQEVMQALLELDCIPAGMELFPAANEDQWSLIKKVIDDCDYYIVIIGGRYGSLGPEGMSFTEMEYRYAVEQKKPVIAFLHKDPGKISSSRSETEPDARAKLEAFRAHVQTKMVRYWETPAEVGSQVSRSLIKLIKAFPAVGWVKADNVPDEGATAEILRLRKRIDELERNLQAVRTSAPAGTEVLAQGDDPLAVHFTFSSYVTSLTLKPFSSIWSTTWNEVFAILAPLMIEEADEWALQMALHRYIEGSQQHILQQNKADSFYNIRIQDDDFHTIKIQLRALGLIAKNTKQRSLKDTATYWTLTPYGDSVMTRLKAVRRESLVPVEESSR
jgi:hypothetical protein